MALIVVLFVLGFTAVAVLFVLVIVLRRKPKSDAYSWPRHWDRSEAIQNRFYKERVAYGAMKKRRARERGKG